MIKDKDGTTLTGTTAVLERWAEYFKELLNVQNETHIEEEIPHTAEVEDEPPTLREVNEAITKLKNNKSRGTDEITNVTLGIDSLINQNSQSIDRPDINQ
ncbi:hypothetical protein M8J76_005648 [Diaphorina citri]|nr:hypothetical protein M8J76_005648 [Diaphorina citri]